MTTIRCTLLALPVLSAAAGPAGRLKEVLLLMAEALPPDYKALEDAGLIEADIPDHDD